MSVAAFYCVTVVENDSRKQSGENATRSTRRGRPLLAGLVEARAKHLHLTQTEELLGVGDEDVDVAAVHPGTLELGLAARQDA